MNTKSIPRVIIDLLLILVLLKGWWFVIIVLGIIGLWRCEHFFEILVAGVGYDALYGMVPRMGIYGYIGSIAGVVIYFGAFLFKKMIRN